MQDFKELEDGLMRELPQHGINTDTRAEVFADIVFSTRVGGGHTQQQLADMANVSVKTVHRIEGGSGGIVDAELKKVLAALGVEWEEAHTYLVKGEAEKTGGRVTE